MSSFSTRVPTLIELCFLRQMDDLQESLFEPVIEDNMSSHTNLPKPSSQEENEQHSLEQNVHILRKLVSDQQTESLNSGEFFSDAELDETLNQLVQLAQERNLELSSSSASSFHDDHSDLTIEDIFDLSQQNLKEDSADQNESSLSVSFDSPQSQPEIDSSSSSVNCPDCQCQFSSSRSLTYHMKSVHPQHYTQSRSFICDNCGATFSQKFNLLRHKKKQVCEDNPRKKLFRCEICNSSFTLKKNLKRHLKNIHEKQNMNNNKSSESCLPALCCKCGKLHPGNSPCMQQTTCFVSQSGRGGDLRSVYSRKQNGRELNGKTKHKRNKCKMFHCHRCSCLCKSKKEMYEHYMTTHQVGGGELQQVPWNHEEDAPWYTDGNVDTFLKKTYEVHSSFILQSHHSTPSSSVYNFPTNDNVSYTDLVDHVKYIYQQENRTFKFNIAFGFILKNIETGEYRYFKPYENLNYLPTSYFISGQEDIKTLSKDMKKLDIISHILQQRKNTKFKAVLITNVLYSVFITDFVLGEGIVPSYIMSNKNIVSFAKHRNKILDDGLCFFRCLTSLFSPLMARASVPFSQQVKKHFTKWQEYQKVQSGREIDIEDFQGINLGEIPQLEQCFHININVFSLHEDLSCTSVYRSLSLFDNTLNLNKYEHHLSYIKDITIYTKKYICHHCNKMFKRKDIWDKHEKICETKVKLRYVGGYYHNPLTIFEQLESYGIMTPLYKRWFKEFIVFDMEAMLEPISVNSTEKLMWTHKHHPISVAICSNVEGFDVPHCIVNADLDELVPQMVQYMEQIVETVRTKKIELYENEIEELDALITSWEQNKVDSIETCKMMLTQLEALKIRFEKYFSEVPVLGFNSARYDLNLIKSKILKCLRMNECKKTGFVVKKTNSYACISNGLFKFLDISQYLSPGSSYVQFLKAFDVEEKKGFFPYEYFKCKEQLKETSLPPLGNAWWSSLKNKSVLDDGVRSIEENYAWLQDVWQKEKMQTFEDFLKWYNELDVYPFVKAVTKLYKFYFEKNIDIFKDSISVPGIARKMAFQEASKLNACFSLINKQNQDLYHIIDDNIVGGPSIIFNRYHKKDETFIRYDQAFPCKKIIGFDANSLYLWCMDQNMPVGSYVRRRAEKGFMLEKNDQYVNMFYWMDWLNKSHSLHINHFRNFGREKRVGPYLVDGYDPITNTAYQFHGCYFHGHQCKLTKHIKKSIQLDYLNKQRERTKSIASYIKQSGHKLVEIYECEFKEWGKRDTELLEFISQQRSPFSKRRNLKVSQQAIIEGVRREELFGLVEVDISIPDSWDEVSSPPNTTLSPQEYFQEMSPIFGNAEIPFESLGTHMQEHIIEHDLSKCSRRLLVGVMKAKQILLATPLLKWYLDHGMKVNKVHQVIEYDQAFPCFRPFVQNVSDARRLGDVDPSKSILAETMKLIGNSAYGSMIMNKMKHRNIYYELGFEAASKAVNEPSFQKLTELSEEFFEIEAFKKSIDLNLPIQIGFFILQLAKMRMLQFYYDFMDVFIDRKHFEYCEMDTDSAYIAVASEKIEDIIKPEFKSIYEKGLKEFCSDNHPEANAEIHWFPRSCCQKHHIYDKRTPGLFKIEFEGEEMIGLCSKTYIIGKKSNYKCSTKGVNKKELHEPFISFRKVLDTGESGKGVNVGFRVREQGICTYSQQKSAFPYLYCKRKVEEDGIHTLPLDITLNPSKKPRL